jgi:hypothetical protein
MPQQPSRSSARPITSFSFIPATSSSQATKSNGRSGGGSGASSNSREEGQRRQLGDGGRPGGGDEPAQSRAGWTGVQSAGSLRRESAFPLFPLLFAANLLPSSLEQLRTKATDSPNSLSRSSAKTTAEFRHSPRRSSASTLSCSLKFDRKATSQATEARSGDGSGTTGMVGRRCGQTGAFGQGEGASREGKLGRRCKAGSLIAAGQGHVRLSLSR